MKAIAILLVALSLAPVTRRTNSHAATERGMKAFEAKAWDTAAKELAEAHRLRPSSQSAFNLGTAQVAVGDTAAAAQSLDAAMRDPSLRGDALYNRGTGALDAGDVDAAIRDLSQALREVPGNAAAKRNLELALRRQENERRSSAGGRERQEGSEDEKEKSDEAKGQQPAPKPGEADPQEILRSIQQQELEELSRMKRPRKEPRVGW